MRLFRFVFRVVLLVTIFVGVGLWSAHAIVARAVAHGRPEYEVRLAAYMTGLFVGGSAATAVGVILLLSGKRTAAAEEPEAR